MCQKWTRVHRMNVINNGYFKLFRYYLLTKWMTNFYIYKKKG